MRKIIIPNTLKFFNIEFKYLSKGIYKSEEMGNELYFDSYITKFPTGEQVKLQIIINHLVLLESKFCKTYEEALVILTSKVLPLTKLKA